MSLAKQSLSILDYNLGNIHSLSNAAANVGFDVKIIKTPEEVLASEKLLLPGVGGFKDAIQKLDSEGLTDAIHEHVKQGKYMLGICLGMQLLFETSEEGGIFRGLGILQGSVTRFPAIEGFKIPQIQWNQVQMHQDSELLSGLSGDEYFYFLHSYYISTEQKKAKISKSNYCNLNYCSAIEYENVLGTQFHPEKSGEVGLAVLKNFYLFGV